MRRQPVKVVVRDLMQKGYVYEAAGAALARIDDARAVDPIRAMSQTHRDPELREKAKAWLEEMEKK